MQTVSDTYNQNDTADILVLYCKPNNTNYISKSDSLQLQADSLQFKYFFNYHCIRFNAGNNTSTEAYRPSMLTSNLLAAKKIQPSSSAQYSTDWIILILLLCFSLFAWILSFSRKRLKQIFKATYANRTINQLVRDGDLLKERLAFPFIIIYFAIFSLFIFQTAHFFVNLKQWGYYSFYFYLKILLLVVVLHYVKLLITKFIGNLFKNNNTAYIYQLNEFIFNIITGIFLLPAMLFAIFSDAVITSFTTYLSVFLIATLIVFKNIRSAIIGLSYSKFSHFYLFLYLCTLEILPFLIIAKIISGIIIRKL